MRLLKIYFGLVLSPVLFPLSLLTLSWDPFRFFFLKKKKSKDGKGAVYLPEYSHAKFKEMTIDSDIKGKYDLRSTAGKQKAFDDQNYRDGKIRFEEDIAREKRLKSITSENKNVVIIIACIFGTLSLLSLYFNWPGLLVLILLALTYFTYLYFKNERIAKFFNAAIRKIKNLSEKKINN